MHKEECAQRNGCLWDIGISKDDETTALDECHRDAATGRVQPVAAAKAYGFRQLPSQSVHIDLEGPMVSGKLLLSAGIDSMKKDGPNWCVCCPIEGGASLFSRWSRTAHRLFKFRTI